VDVPLAAEMSAGMPKYRHPVDLRSYAFAGFGVGIPRARVQLMPTDTVLIFCCPYCRIGTDFRPLTAHKDGRFVCRDCAHTVRPGEPNYKCICRNCMKAGREEIQRWALYDRQS
jgi:hypothetical protein